MAGAGWILNLWGAAEPRLIYADTVFGNSLAKTVTIITTTTIPVACVNAQTAVFPAYPFPEFPKLAHAGSQALGATVVVGPTQIPMATASAQPAAKILAVQAQRGPAQARSAAGQCTVIPGGVTISATRLSAGSSPRQTGFPAGEVLISIAPASAAGDARALTSVHGSAMVIVASVATAKGKATRLAVIPGATGVAVSVVGVHSGVSSLVVVPPGPVGVNMRDVVASVTAQRIHIQSDGVVGPVESINLSVIAQHATVHHGAVTVPLDALLGLVTALPISVHVGATSVSFSVARASGAALSCAPPGEAIVVDERTVLVEDESRFMIVYIDERVQAVESEDRMVWAGSLSERFYMVENEGRMPLIENETRASVSPSDERTITMDSTGRTVGVSRETRQRENADDREATIAGESRA